MSNREEHKMRRDAGGTPPLNRLATWCALFLILVLLRAADASPLDEARALHEEAQRILTGDRPSQERHALAIRLLSAARTLLGDTGTPEARGLLREVSAALYWARKFQRTSQDPSQPSADETSAQCAFQKADDLEHSRTASVETIRRAYEEVRDRYPGTSWAIRAGMRVHSVAEPTPAPQRDPSPAQPRDQGPPLLDEFTLAVRERRLDDAWGWLDRARKQPPSEPVDLAAVEADLATLDWVAIRALGAMLGKVGGPIRATRHDGHCIEGILQRADPFGLLIETPAGTERVGFHDLSDATLAEIASATTFERGVLALRSGDLDGATVRFHACRDVRTRARCEEITRLAQAGSTPPR